VGWSSGQYPEALAVAMRNSDRVVSAWGGEKLVGFMNALSDGAMTAYFHYLLVRPEYQGRVSAVRSSPPCSTTTATTPVRY
jgi:hypothetical protein